MLKLPKKITATVQEPGKMLIFSIPGMGSKELITRAAAQPEVTGIR